MAFPFRGAQVATLRNGQPASCRYIQRRTYVLLKIVKRIIKQVGIYERYIQTMLCCLYFPYELWALTWMRFLQDLDIVLQFVLTFMNLSILCPCLLNTRVAQRGLCRALLLPLEVLPFLLFLSSGLHGSVVRITFPSWGL